MLLSAEWGADDIWVGEVAPLKWVCLLVLWCAKWLCLLQNAAGSSPSLSWWVQLQGHDALAKQVSPRFWWYVACWTVLGEGCFACYSFHSPFPCHLVDFWQVCTKCWLQFGTWKCCECFAKVCWTTFNRKHFEAICLLFRQKQVTWPFTVQWLSLVT